MKRKFLAFLASAFLLLSNSAIAQELITFVDPATEAGENLDLPAVLVLFQEVETVEDFEKALNDPERGVNNLDLNQDGQVDYIRVVEHVEGNGHLLVLQVPLAANEYQDMATINIEKDDDQVVLQAAADPDIYGKDYYLEPDTKVVVHIHTWPLIRTIYAPGYTRWRSPWRWRTYPRWWRPWKPVSRSHYLLKVTKWTNRKLFRHTTVRRSVRVHKIYKPRRKSSALAVQKKKKLPPKKKPKKPRKPRKKK